MVWWAAALILGIVVSAGFALFCLIVISMPWYPDDDGFSDEEDS